MKNKKTAMIVSTIAIISFFGVLFFLVNSNDEVDINTVRTDECNLSGTQEYINEASENRDLDTCNCIEDIDMQKDCVEYVYDYIAFSEALRQLDTEVCEEMHDEDYKKDCIVSVNKDIEKIANDNPEQLAFIYFLEHNTDKAIAEYEKLINTNDGQININHYLNLASMYAEKALNQQEQGFSDEIFIQKALDTINKAEEYDKYNSEVHRVKGYIEEVRGDIGAALKNYNNALKMDSGNMLAYAGRGHAHDVGGMRKKAIEDFLTADSLDVEHSNMFIQENICRLLSNSSNDELVKKAINSCTNVINSVGYDKALKSEAGIILGYVYMNKELYAKSQENLLIAQKIYPNNANVQIAFSNLSLKQNKFDEAIEYASEAIDIAPTKSTAYVPYSQSLYLKKDYDTAIKKAEIGLSLIDDDVSLLFSDKNSVKNQLLKVISDSHEMNGG